MKTAVSGGVIKGRLEKTFKDFFQTKVIDEYMHKDKYAFVRDIIPEELIYDFLGFFFGNIPDYGIEV